MLSRLLEQLKQTFDEYDIPVNHRNLFIEMTLNFKPNKAAPIIVKEIDGLKNRRAHINYVDSAIKQRENCIQ